MRKANFTLKKAWQYSLVCLLMLAIPLMGTAQTFTGTGNPQGLGTTDGGVTTPANITSTSTGTAMIAGGAVIGTDVELTSVAINAEHTFANDLEIVLVSPAGTRVTLSSDNGSFTGLDAAATLTFTDASANDVNGWDGNAPLADYRAEGGANIFPILNTEDGPGVDLNTILAGENANGDWILEVFDDASGDSGTLNSFEITFTAIIATGPSVAAPDPICDQSDVISMFSNAYTDVPVDTWLTPWSPGATVYTELQIAGNDTKLYENVDFLGIEMFGTPIDASGMTYFNVDIWTPDMTTFRVKLVDFDGGAFSSEGEIAFTPTQSGWNTFSIPMADFANPALVTGLTLNNADELSQLIFSGLPTGSGSFYVDNIYFSTSACPTAAPEPTCDAANVISMFSNAYTDVPVDTWLTPWSPGGTVYTELQIGGNDTKLYENVDFLGIEMFGSPIDASAMTTFNVDVWTADMTTFRVKLVDFDGGAFSSEGEIAFTPTQLGWNTFAIPMADFANPALVTGPTLNNADELSQLIFSGLPTGSGSFYVDNIYFSTCGPPVPDPCSGNVAIENLANGMDYTIVSDADGNVDITLTVVDAPAGLVGFLGGPGGIFQVAGPGGTFNYSLTGQNDPYVLDMFFNWAAGGAGNSETVTASCVAVELDPCSGNVAIENLANGMDYTIVSDNAGNVDVTLTVVDNPAGLVGFLGGPGGVFQVAGPGGTFNYSLTGQNDPYVLDMFFNWAAGGAGNSETVTASCAPVAGPVAIEFCVDLSCYPVSDAVALAGSFNGFNPGTDFLMQDMGNRIYCKTLNLDPGDYDFMFFFAQGQFETLDITDDCTVSSPTAPNGGVARQITVVDGMPASYTYGWESCDEVCTPPPGADIEFCVDIGCLDATNINIFGGFNNWCGVCNPLTDPDGDGIWCTTIFMAPGDQEFKFLVNGVEESFTPGDDCTVSCCDNQFTNRFITVVDGMDQETEYVYNVPCESTFDEPTVVFPALATVCGGDVTITLGGATPAGGVYSGTGVTDNGDGLTFDVDLSGLGPDGYSITYTLAGELECEYTASSTLGIEDCGFAITDPCSCNDDASPITFDAEAGTYTNPNDGTFGEIVAITGGGGGTLPAGLDFRVVAVDGAFGVAVGDPLTYDANMHYSIAFDHADDVGYTITVDQFIAGNAVGFNFAIGNACAYPTPVFDPELDPIYCNFEGAITLGGTDDDDVNGPAMPDGVTFTINGVDATVFNPTALPSGLNTVVMTYIGADDGNGGISPDGGTTPAYRGCTQTVETVIEVENFGPACISDVNVTLSENCDRLITPGMVLTGNYACADEIVITVDGGNTNVISGCGAHTYSVDIFVAGEMVYTCWGNLFAEDKTDPVVECPADTDEVTVDFDLQTLEGSIDGTEPTIALDDYSCFQSFFEPAAGVDYNYDLITFTVDPDLPATDVYNIQTASNIPGLNIALFQGAFNEDNPCENILGGSEGAYFVDPFFGVNAFFDQDFRIEMPLEPGQTYTLMVANTSFGTTGDYVIGIVSDNGGQFIGGGFSAPAPVAVT
ncbi:proprotein convertase P-domain-containing protein, partial [Lewinella cohaerens]|uniref:proprotein convertase P-domain-containing protein n=1 Tax=Lewinella cohaerens TaxID=70995 RepID=UPI0005C5DB25